jgi:hypothetical protein
VGHWVQILPLHSSHSSYGLVWPGAQTVDDHIGSGGRGVCMDKLSAHAATACDGAELDMRMRRL